MNRGIELGQAAARRLNWPNLLLLLYLKFTIYGNNAGEFACSKTVVAAFEVRFEILREKLVTGFDSKKVDEFGNLQ